MIKLTSVHRDWIIDMTPDTLLDGFSARAWVQREAGEGETQGENFMFSDLGQYATQGDAASRGESWAIRWLTENDY
jgi:hypothetical protein